MRTRPNLVPAEERHKRAQEHLVDLEARSKRFFDEYPDPIMVEPHPKQPGNVILHGDARALFPPYILNILVGETINNLRSCLDYLVYDLAWLDSGSRQEKTQMPIEDFPYTTQVGGKKRSGFWNRRGSYLRGVNDAHVARIEEIQPYKGVNWTRVLREISNADKHREPVGVGRREEGGTARIVNVYRPGEGTAPDAQPIQTNVNVDPVTARFITLEDGTPIVETLQVLQSEVGALIQEFKPDF